MNTAQGIFTKSTMDIEKELEIMVVKYTSGNANISNNNVIYTKTEEEPQKADLNPEEEEVSRLNPETELLTDRDPDEKIRKQDDKFSVNRHNKNQPF